MKRKRRRVGCRVRSVKKTEEGDTLAQNTFMSLYMIFVKKLAHKEPTTSATEALKRTLDDVS